MASGTSDLTVVPKQEGDERSMVLDPSIQASLQRTSSVVSEYFSDGDDLSAGMESSNPVASSKNSEIIEDEDDPSLGMELSFRTTSSLLDSAEDEQSSEIGSTSSPEMEVNPSMEDLSRASYDKEGNPFMKDLSGASYDEEALVEHFSELKQKLKDGLESVYALLEPLHVMYGFKIECSNMRKAKEKVQELFFLYEAIEFMIRNWRDLLKTPIPETDLYQPYFKADYHPTDIYLRLIIRALSYTTKLEENPCYKTDLHKNPSISWITITPVIVAYLSEYFEAVDFMVFLINKVQEEEDIMAPSLALQEAKSLVTKYVHKYEEETISTCICLVVNVKVREAEYLFKSVMKHMKPSDTIMHCKRHGSCAKYANFYPVQVFLRDIIQRWIESVCIEMRQPS